MVQNIILTRRWPAEVEREFAKAVEGKATLQLNHQDVAFDRQKMAWALSEADILCPTVTDKLDRELLHNVGVKTKLLANFGVGFNHIDMPSARQQQISVTNTPGVLTEATAEIALTLMLSVARRSAAGERLVRSGKWQGWYPTQMLSTQVTGKTLGIVGMGRIGMALAKKAHFGLGMRIVYCSRNAVSPGESAPLAAQRMDLSELLSVSDFVSLHCPATPETYHLINADRLGEMRKHAFLINTARGDVVDEAALSAALANGVIAGAGLDVYEHEPDVPKVLIALENIVLLPHMGSGTTETRVAMGRCAMDNVLAYLAGKPLLNPLDTQGV